MGNYQEKQSHTVNKFQLDLYPYLAAPENRFEDGVALQYGADFKMRFSRSGNQKNKVGLIQLIFPQTKIFQRTVVGAWNVDKGQPAENPITMGRSLYGDDISLIGIHSEYYSGMNMRCLSEAECWLIDTPREINASFNKGAFAGVTNTKFANYVVEMSSKNGIIFNQGVVWGYSVVQNTQNLEKFDFLVQKPREVLLRENSEHQTAIAAFLNQEKDAIKSFIS